MAGEENSPVVGHEVTVRLRIGGGNVATHEKTFHWRGSAASCRRRGMLKTGAIEIVKVVPVSDAEWRRAYGVPGLRM